jgi:hypothetical protein
VFGAKAPRGSLGSGAVSGRPRRTLKRLKRSARKHGPVGAIVLLLAAGAYAAPRLLLGGEDKSLQPASVRVRVLAPGTFAAAHAYAPYYVVPTTKLSGPSKLSPAATAKFVTQAESALAKGATAGSPQIVRIELRAQDQKPVTVEAVSAKIVSDGRPLKGWFIASPGCGVERTVRVANVNLDVARKRTRKLGIKIARTDRTIVEIQASTRRRRAAWVAELTVSGEGRSRATIVVDDHGKPFRMTSPTASRGYEPVYGATGITGFDRRRGWDDGVDTRC